MPSVSKSPAARSHDAVEISQARDYYRRILPFYEKESVARAHLFFWRALAREQAPRRILEIGAGLGRITAALAAVAPCVGTDVSLEMLSSARRRRAAGIAFVAADARRTAFRGSFDLIVAPGDPISHMTNAADRRATLRAVARQLAPGGLFVLEGLYRRRRAVALPPRRVRHADGVLTIEESWLPFGARSLWHARYRYRDVGTDGSVRMDAAAFEARAWDPATIRQEFRSCGLSVTRLWGDFDRRPFRRGAPRVVVVAKRTIRPGTRLAPLVGTASNR